MSNYTKGPWEVKIDYSEAPYVCSRERKMIADLNHVYLPKDEVINNAHLIAAAPDLLEACEYAFKNLKPAGNIRKDFSGHNAMATLSKAIAKATGKEV